MCTLNYNREGSINETRLYTLTKPNQSGIPGFCTRREGDFTVQKGNSNRLGRCSKYVKKLRSERPEFCLRLGYRIYAHFFAVTAETFEFNSSVDFSI